MFVGSMRYCSLNMIKKITPSRRDDLESVIYMLSEFANGDLPWSKNLGGPKIEDTIREIKINLSPSDISTGLPSEFRLLFQYVRALGFEDRPDYQSAIEMLEAGKEKLRLK